MSRPAPSFPAFEDWKRMSEREQDALLDRLETQKRRSNLMARLLIAVGTVTVALAAGFVLLALR